MGRRGKARTRQPGAKEPPARSWLPPLLIVAAGIAAYHNSFSGAFMLDDKNQIVENLRIRSLENVSGIVSRSRRPVADLTFAVNYAVGKLEVRGYHAVNLAVHILAGLTLFGVVRRTLLTRRFGQPNDAIARWIALATALIWVVHPLQTQAVSYVIQRCEALMGLFYLLTLYCAARGFGSPRSWAWSVAAICCCGLGMGSKAIMVTAPAMVVFYDRVFLFDSVKEAVRRRWGLYAGLAATWLVLGLCGVVRGILFPGDVPATAGFGTRGITPVQYLATQPGVILHYLRLSLWPSPLCLDYAWPVAKSAGAIVVPAIVIAVLVGATLVTLKKRPGLGFVGAWFFIILVPTSSFIPIKDPIFEHRMYLSLAAVVLLAVLAGRAALRSVSGRSNVSHQKMPGVAALLVGVVVAAGIAGTVRRNHVYRSRLAMWTDVVTKRPDNSRAQTNLGLALTDEGRKSEALERYEKAASIDQTNFMAQYNLGNSAFRDKKYEEAVTYYREAVRLKASYTEAHVNWAMALDNLGRAEEAVERFRQALETQRPGSRSKAIYEAHFNLANTLFRIGRLDEAEKHYRLCLKARASHIQARYNLAHTLMKQNELDEAVKELEGVLRRKPKHAAAQQTLNALLQAKKQSTTQTAQPHRNQ